MKTTCLYCGGLHRHGERCPSKPSKPKKDTQANRFRQTRTWRNKATEIKIRDKYLCQWCLYKHNTPNTKNLEVHHIDGLAENYNKRLDDDNLITLCRTCHEEADDGRIKKTDLQALISPRG